MELYAIRYGISKFPVKFIYRDMAFSEEDTDLAWCYYVAGNKGKYYLIDTGFRNPIVAKKWGVKLLDISGELKLFSNVMFDTVIITHSHLDHIGNLDLYSNAVVYIAKKEYDAVFSEPNHPAQLPLKRNRVVTIEYSQNIDDAFTFKVIGGHTAGSSVLFLKNNFVITGDECYVCNNMLEARPIGGFLDTRKNEEFIKMAQSQQLTPLPFHDMGLFEKYRKISDNIVKIL